MTFFGKLYITIGEHSELINLQWNPSGSIAATLGEQNVGRYIGVAFIEGLFCTHKLFIWDLCSWPLY